jgi:hypothetical protein
MKFLKNFQFFQFFFKICFRFPKLLLRIAKMKFLKNFHFFQFFHNLLSLPKLLQRVAIMKFLKGDRFLSFFCSAEFCVVDKLDCILATCMPPPPTPPSSQVGNKLQIYSSFFCDGALRVRCCKDNFSAGA